MDPRWLLARASLNHTNRPNGHGLRRRVLRQFWPGQLDRSHNPVHPGPRRPLGHVVRLGHALHHIVVADAEIDRGTPQHCPRPDASHAPTPRHQHRPARSVPRPVPGTSAWHACDHRHRQVNGPSQLTSLSFVEVDELARGLVHADLPRLTRARSSQRQQPATANTWTPRHYHTISLSRWHRRTAFTRINPGHMPCQTGNRSTGRTQRHPRRASLRTSRSRPRRPHRHRDDYRGLLEPACRPRLDRLYRRSTTTRLITRRS